MSVARRDLEEVFRDQYPRLVASLSLIAGRPAAEDAVQTAFERAGVRWRRVSRYDDPAGWIRRVALNLLLNERRRLDRFSSETVADRTSSWTNQAVSEVDVTRALDTLAPMQRAYVVLHYLEDMSVDEVAATLDRRSGSVKSGLHDARRSMATYLGESYGTG